MYDNKREKITVETIVGKTVGIVWELWTDPAHIMRWNNASHDWQTTYAENDLSIGGRFLSRMEAKDGSTGFDFSGKYDFIDLYSRIDYTLDDNRKVSVIFKDLDEDTMITEVFEAEDENTIELQKNGWQAILDNFRRYAERSR